MGVYWALGVKNIEVLFPQFLSMNLSVKVHICYTLIFVVLADQVFFIILIFLQWITTESKQIFSLFLSCPPDRKSVRTGKVSQIICGTWKREKNRKIYLGFITFVINSDLQFISCICTTGSSIVNSNIDQIKPYLLCAFFPPIFSICRIFEKTLKKNYEKYLEYTFYL